MSKLREFLHGTVGRHLYDFWLDCEFYRDTVDDHNDAHSRMMRSRLFRSVRGIDLLSAAVNLTPDSQTVLGLTFSPL